LFRPLLEKQAYFFVGVSDRINRMDGIRQYETKILIILSKINEVSYQIP